MNTKNFDSNQFVFFGPAYRHSSNLFDGCGENDYAMARNKETNEWFPWDKNGPRPYSGESKVRGKVNSFDVAGCGFDGYVLRGDWVKIKLKEINQIKYIFE